MPKRDATGGGRMIEPPSVSVIYRSPTGASGGAKGQARDERPDQQIVSLYMRGLLIVPAIKV